MCYCLSLTNQEELQQNNEETSKIEVNMEKVIIISCLGLIIWYFLKWVLFISIIDSMKSDEFVVLS